jgi:hypothetical protein
MGLKIDEILTIGSSCHKKHIPKGSPQNSTVDQTGQTDFKNRSDLFFLGSSGRTSKT